MAFKVDRKPANRPERSVYTPDKAPSTIVCTYFLEGRCTKKFCKFFHPPKPMNPHTLKQKPLVWKRDGNSTRKGYACSPTQKINTAQKRNFTERSNAAQEGNTTQKRSFTQKIDAAQEGNTAQKRSFTQKIDAAQEGNTVQKRIYTQKVDAAQEGNTEQKRSSTQKVDAAQKSNTVQESNYISKRSPPQINNASDKTQAKVCKFWVEGNCAKGDQCLYMRKWFCGEGLSTVANLLGHTKAITGIALPEGSTKLYSAGKDGTVRVWDCHTGQCDSVFNLDGDVGSLISEGPWLFVGLQNLVKARHLEANAEFNLSGPVGQVHALAVGNEMLFGGAQDGVISMWKLCMGTNNHSATLKGHTGAVVCLTVGRNRLYSGSVDHTVRVWDLDTLQCVNTLNGHSGAVMSLICWDQFLISCSLDCTIKVWTAAEGGNWEVTYTRTEDDGLLSSITVAENKAIVACSCNDNCVRLYELPSFTERGRLFAKEEVRTLQVGPGGLFFSGDATGLLSVWKWMDAGGKVSS